MHKKALRFLRNLFLFVGTVFLIAGCANQLPPNGGPIDTTTPEIISVYPDNNALNFKDSHIRIEFDRYVDERKVEESIFISPYVGTLEFDWSGTEVTIIFSEKLRSNTTYIVNVGTDVTDRRNGNRMAKAYTLAFSTGPDIDRGGIEGLVFPMKEGDAAAGIMIFAYQLNGLDPDTVNPMTTKPDFITQTGKSGDFFLHHIPFGAYRIFAIKDEFRNLVYDKEADEFGVPPNTINITMYDTLSTGVMMKLAKEDTSGVLLVKVTAFNQNHVTAEFSESLDPASVNLKSFSIIDTINQKPLDILTIYPLPTNRASYTLVTRKQDSLKRYRLSTIGITDSAGNIINPLSKSLTFQGSQKADTLGTRLVSASIKDSTQNIDLQPVWTLTFSDAIAKTTSLDFVNIFDNKKQIVTVEKKWMSDVMISLKPEKELSSLTWYSLRAELRKVNDWVEHACKDSTKTWRFETFDIEDMSSVEGIVVDENKSDTTGQMYITAFQIGEKSSKQYTAVADATGRFIFPLVAEGRYVLQTYRDRNNNGTYDFGKPFPFVHSERMSSFSDTLKVRARWPLEGVQIKMK